LLGKEDLVIAISQSGETADTLAAVRLAKEQGATTLGLINVVDSTIAREANLKLLNIELETVSAARSLIGNDPTPSVLIDMGHRDTTISIVDRAFLRISHSVETSGEDLTRALSQNLNVSWRRAEELKKQNGIKAINSNDQMIKVLTPMIDIIADAASNVIDLYTSRSRKKVEKLILCQGTSRLKQI